MKVLQEQIEHHVEEEEKPKTGVFAQARDADLDVKLLGEKMAARKEELTASYRAAGVPKPELSTMDEVEA